MYDTLLLSFHLFLAHALMMVLGTVSRMHALSTQELLKPLIEDHMGKRAQPCYMLPFCVQQFLFIVGHRKYFKIKTVPFYFLCWSWNAGNYSQFWGMTLDEGIQYRLGTTKPSSSVMNMNEMHVRMLLLILLLNNSK